MHELAVLAARVAFSNDFPGTPPALMISPGDGSAETGYVLKRNLEVVSLERGTPTRRRRRRRMAEYAQAARFMPELAQTRLERFRRGETSVRAACRVTDSLQIELTDDTPWARGIDLMWAGPRMQPILPQQFGFDQKWIGHTLSLRPSTPEATLRFTAWLANGQSLVLQHGYKSNRDARKLVVRLRDFDGDRAEMRVIAGTAHAEPWLVQFPTLSMRFGVDDRLAIARWAYPLNTWMTDDFVEKLF
jgi:hypothetical protein